MQFPLNFSDASFFLAMIAIILTGTAIFISPYNQQTNILLEKRRLLKAALTLCILFLFTILIRILEIII